jgi:hypothetical protein
MVSTKTFRSITQKWQAYSEIQIAFPYIDTPQKEKDCLIKGEEGLFQKMKDERE